MKLIIKVLAFIVGFLLVLYTGILIGREQMEDIYHEEVTPYKEVLLGCLNNGAFHFPDTLEAFSCSTTYLGTLKGPYKNEPSNHH